MLSRRTPSRATLVLSEIPACSLEPRVLVAAVHQGSLFAESDTSVSQEILDAVESLRSEGELGARGAVFTASVVVDAILDLCNYSADRDLEEVRILEPSFGRGDFLFPVVRRLLASFDRRGRDPRDDLTELRRCIRAVELHRETFQDTRGRLGQLLQERGFGGGGIETLLDDWLINGDYLLTEGLGTFDVVVGNPPYVRQERIPRPLVRTYRARFDTFVSRADLYIVFYEKGLLSLRPKGRLGFICANRWVKNKYGGALRSLVGHNFQLEYFIDLERADAFKDEVIAYPAITIMRKHGSRSTLVATGLRDSTSGLNELVPDLQAVAAGEREPGTGVQRVEVTRESRDPWLLDAPDLIETLRRLERQFPPLEAAGAKVTIGVATGADRVFLGQFEELPVERSRKLPLAMASDCRDGRVEWSGMGVVNPFMPDGSLAPLEDFPRLGSYLRQHEAVLRGRHVAKRNPRRWYKTIDRIYPDLLGTPKLLIPDIKGHAAITYDPGEFYPHHNLYVVMGTTWETRALMTVLRSSIAFSFVAAYSPRMAGGFLRFQAQYLRKIRCPRWDDLNPGLKTRLVDSAFAEQDACDDVVFDAFGVQSSVREKIRSYAESARVPVSSQ